MDPLEGKPRRGLLGIAAALVLLGAAGAYLYFPALRGGTAPRPTLSPQPGIHLQSALYPSADSAWVAVIDDTGRAGIFATTDRGGTWKPLLNLPRRMQQLVLQSLSDRQAVVLARDALSQTWFYVTWDRGNHWVELAPSGLPSRISTATFVDGDQAWALESATGAATVTRLYHSADGGRSWTKVANFPIRTEFSGYVGSGMFFWSDSVGWLSTITRGKDPMLYPDPFVLGTRDGGLTWERQRLPAPESGWPSGLQVVAATPVCFEAGRCLLTASLTSGADLSQPVYVYATDDSGGSWSGPVTVPAPASAVYFASQTTWWAVARMGVPVPVNGGPGPASARTNLLSTTDGGGTWLSLDPQLPPAVNGLAGIVIEGPMVAWASGERWSAVAGRMAAEPVLVRTSSAGARWSEVSLPSLG